MLRHGCNNQGVAGKELMLLACGCGILNQRLGDWKHLHGHERDAGEGLAINAQTGNLGMVFAQPCSNSSNGPALQADRFERHQAVGHVGHDVCRSEAPHLLELDALQELGTGHAVLGVVGEMVNECVRVDKDRRPRRDAGERHGDSRMLKSSSSAMRRNTAGSPVHLSMPAVRSAQVRSGAMVMRTFSWSCKGSGCAGFSTPFS